MIESRRRILEADVRQVPQQRKRELFAALTTFAGLLIKDVRLLEKMVWEGSMDLEESVAVQHWMRKGEEKGLKQGLEQGILEARRADLLAVLSSRFGPMKKGLKARILRVEDAALLEKLIRRAAVVKGPGQLLREIP